MGPGAGISSPPVASRGEIAAIVETLTLELDEISATLADTVHEHLAELDDDMRPWTLQAARSNLGVIVTMMREGTDPRSVQPPPEAIGYAEEYVVRGLELSLMQLAYRTAQGVFGGIILERLRAATDDPDHLAEAMAFFNAWIFAWVEAVERRLTDVYMDEHQQWLRGAAAVRAAEVRALLGGAAPLDAVAVSLRLGYELDRFHVGFVVWSEETGERPGDAGGLFAAMEGAAAAVAKSPSCAASAPSAASPSASSAISPPPPTPPSDSPRPWRSSSKRDRASSAPPAASASTPTPSPTASAAPKPCSAARSASASWSCGSRCAWRGWSSASPKRGAGACPGCRPRRAARARPGRLRCRLRRSSRRSAACLRRAGRRGIRSPPGSGGRSRGRGSP